MMKLPIKIYCKKPYLEEPLVIMQVFQNTYKHVFSSEIEIKQMKTTSVFPEMITNENQTQLCWDMQYWDYFDRFLAEIAYLLEDKSYKDMFSINVCALFLDYLSLKLIHIPELAHCIQVSRKQKFSTLDQKIKHMSQRTFERYIFGNYESIRVQAKHLVFNHELFHVYFKKNPIEKSCDSSRLSRLVEFYIDHDLKENIQGSDLTKTLIEGFEAIIKSDAEKMIEEASCDYRALIETLALYRKIDSQRENDFIYQIHETFQINQTLLSYLANILSCWTILYKNYLKAERYDELIPMCQPEMDKAAQIAIVRNTIIPDFLKNLSISKYNMEFPTNILEDDYIRDIILETTSRLVDLDFMLDTIEESIRLSNRLDYNPFYMKEVVLKNADYI